MMENSDEIEDLRERDRLLYGNPDGPTFDQLVEENRRRGFQGVVAYERIIEGSQVTNRAVNKLFDCQRAAAAGTLFAAMSVVASDSRIAYDED